MSDIFISYKREDQGTARKLADALEKEGWSVWWDPKLRAGERFNDVIEKALKESKCVVVMWSKRSVESLYVKDEATYALKRNKLVPVMIEEVELPFRFEDLHTPSLRGWNGSKDAPDFCKLVHDIAEIVGPPVPEAKSKARGQRTAEKERLREQERQWSEEEVRPKADEALQKLLKFRRRTISKPDAVFRDRLKDGSQGPDAKHINAPASQDILREGYHDRQVEEVRIQLNQLHTKAHDQATFLRSKMFAILRGLFVGRNTFIEPADDCREESWAERLIATIETRRLIQAYRPVIIEHAKPGDEELVRSYDQLNLHSYVQELTGLFDPRPGVYKITEQLRRGNVDVVKLELKGAEIHPKERIDPKVIQACNKRQSEIKGIWEQWPVM
jgi:hypothetical protein